MCSRARSQFSGEAPWELGHLDVLDLSAKERGCPVAANRVIAELGAGDLAMIVGDYP